MMVLRHSVKLAILVGLALPAVAFGQQASSPKVELVSDATIQLQRQLTSVHRLKNGIPVIVREIPNSDILQLNITFGTGLKDLPPGRKVLNEWLWSVMPMAATGYPKAAVNTTSEKYGLEIGCSGGIEYSICALGTLNDYWNKALPLFAAIVTKPAITPEDTRLTKDRLVATLIDIPSDPGTYVNEIINQIFYPVGHPYRLNHDEAIKELQHLDRNDLLAYHKSAVNADGMSIVVVTSMPAAKVIADLNKAFGGIKAAKRTNVIALAPTFNDAHAFQFDSRNLPTAYIRIKLNAPSVHDKDSIAMRLVYEMLSEELGEEIRTKRSLSYAVHSYVIEYSLGIGVISASTSKPQETLAAINDVLQSFRAKNYSDEELEEYKHGFATNYYLSQETHSSLATALSNAWFFYGDPNQYYELPRQLDKVTPADVKRLANTWLTDLRVGVIYGRNQFKDEWALELIKKNLKGAPPETPMEAKPIPSPDDAEKSH